MSTVAARKYNYGDKWMVCFSADKRMSWHNTTVTKVWELDPSVSPFVLVGGAGTYTSVLQAVTWISEGADPNNKPELDEKDFHLLGCDQLGNFWLAADSLEFMPIEADIHAIGSGGHYAMGAMLAGSTPERAVELACLVDEHSGNGVTSLAYEIPFTSEEQE